MPKPKEVAAGVPKENPPPDTVLFAGVPKPKEFVAPCVPVPKEKPPPGAAGVELVIPKVEPVAVAVVF